MKSVILPAAEAAIGSLPLSPKRDGEDTMSQHMDSAEDVVQVPHKFFGFGPVDVPGYMVMISDQDRTVTGCTNSPDLASGKGEVATIPATTCPQIDWHRAASYLERIASRTLRRGFRWLADHAGAIRDDVYVYALLLDLAKGSGRAFLHSSTEKPHARHHRLPGRLATQPSAETNCAKVSVPRGTTRSHRER